MTDTAIVLAPSYRLPIGLIGLALPLWFWQPWIGGLVAVLGAFLLVQAASLRLWFTASALELYRGETRLRQFPYAEWQHWQIFWQPVPILLYFKEINSIHFLPILFDPQQLRQCLIQRCPRIS